jgi:hypothetical protein
VVDPDVFVVEKGIKGTIWPSHKNKSDIGFTFALGFTSIVKLFDIPEQFAPKLEFIGVTVIVAVIGLNPKFVAVKLIEPDPAAARPIAGFELTQA